MKEVVIRLLGREFTAAICPKCGAKIYPIKDMAAHKERHEASSIPTKEPFAKPPRPRMVRVALLLLLLATPLYAADSPGGIQLNWTDRATNETHQVVWRRQLQGNRYWYGIQVVEPNVTSWFDDEVRRGRRYEYQVCANNDSGDACSNIVQVTAP